MDENTGRTALGHLERARELMVILCEASEELSTLYGPLYNAINHDTPPTPVTLHLSDTEMNLLSRSPGGYGTGTLFTPEHRLLQFLRYAAGSPIRQDTYQQSRGE